MPKMKKEKIFQNSSELIGITLMIFGSHGVYSGENIGGLILFLIGVIVYSILK